MQKTARGGDAPATMNGALEIANASLIPVIVIGVARNTGGNAARYEGFRYWIEPIHIGDRNATIAAAAFLTKAKALFAAHVIGQAIRIAPAAIAALRPAILIAWLAAIIDHAIDGRTAAQRAPLHGFHAAPRGIFRGFRAELPGDVRVHQSLDETSGDMNEGVGIGRPGFQHANRGLWVFREPRSKDRSRRPGTDNDIIEGIGFSCGHTCLLLLFRKKPSKLWGRCQPKTGGPFWPMIRARIWERSVA